MAPVVNGRVLFNSIPEGFPEPGKTLKYDVSETIDPNTVPLNGGYLLKTLVVSSDAFLREMMIDPDIDSFLPWRYTVGKSIFGFAVGVVVRSELDGVKVGEHYAGVYPFQNYNILSEVDPETMMLIKNEYNLPWSAFVGVCGMPGQTAYMGWKEYSKAQKGETVYVTTGAGPVGSFVIQLAKKDGLKVIASAGSQEKVDLLRDTFGADVVFNYKEAEISEVLSREGGIDIYWDNVGGASLDAALQNSKKFARFIECGMIVGYNTNHGPGSEIKNIYSIVQKSIVMSGFVVMDLFPKYMEEFFEVVPKLVSTGEIKYTEHVSHGLESVEQSLLDIFSGKNVGKAVTIVANE